MMFCDSDANGLCPACASSQITSSNKEHEFEYGVGKDAIMLTATIPIRHCLSCGFDFTDDVAEEIEHTVVCGHLGCYTPQQIREIRIQSKISVGELASLMRVDAKTVDRWERGAIIQTPSQDHLLYLLTEPRNIEMLRDRS